MSTKNTALFIIDMQNDFVLPESRFSTNAYKVVQPITSVLERFRQAGLPVFHIVREYRADGSDVEQFRYQIFIDGGKCAVPGTKGSEIVEPLTPIEGEYKIIKPRFSAFMGTELGFILQRLGITDIVVTGTQYPNCVRATVYDAIAYGYSVTVLTDATSAATEEVAQANIVDFKNVGVACIYSDNLEINERRKAVSTE